MADVFTKERRSLVMSSIKARDTKPEIRLRKLLHARGFRYRLGGGGLAGKPDIVLPRHKAAIFMHGCFWHGHENCRKFKLPSGNRPFWEAKIAANRERDLKVVAALCGSGWRIAVVWECAVATKAEAEANAAKVAGWLDGGMFETLELRGREPTAVIAKS